MKKFSIHKPFEVLKGLRDGELKHIIQFTTRISPHSILPYVRNLEKNGLIAIDNKTGGIIANKSIFETLSILNIGLSELKEFDSVSSVITDPVYKVGKIKSVDKGKNPEVFVIMPFLSRLQPIFDEHIKPVINGLGYECYRGDDVFTTNSIIEDIWNSIIRANFVIADCTDRNPNVFYEIGIAHVFGKQVILLSQNINDIPFDLRHRRVIIYEPTSNGIKELGTSLKETIKSFTDESITDREYSYDRFNIDFPI